MIKLGIFYLKDDVWNNFDVGNQFENYYDNYDNNNYNFEYNNYDEQQADKSLENASEKSPLQLNKSSTSDKVTVTSKENKAVENLKKAQDFDSSGDELVDLLDKIEDDYNQKKFTSNEPYRTPVISRLIEQERPKNSKVANKKPNEANSKQPPAYQAPLTPMPNYNEMNTPIIRDNLKKFGLKALPKKQAIKKLVEIYEFTHKDKLSGLQRSHSCLSLKDLPASSLKKTTSNVNISNSINDDQLIEQAAMQMNLEKPDKPVKKRLKKTVSDVGFANKKATTSSQMSSMGAIKEPETTSLLKVGVKPKKKTQSEAHECTLDDKLLEMVNEEDDSETTDVSEASPAKGSQLLLSKKKTKEKKTIEEDELREIVCDCVRSDQNFYLNILNFEPVDYESFLVRLQCQVAPKKINNKTLMKVLDEFCITFTLKNLNTRGGASSKLKSKKKT